MNKIFKKSVQKVQPVSYRRKTEGFVRQICAVTPSDFGAMASKFFLTICNGAILFGEHNILIRFLVFGQKEKKVSHGGTPSHQLDLNRSWIVQTTA